MARDFDGTDDNLLSADNVVTGIDVNQRSVACWVIRDTSPVANQLLYVECSANGAGNARMLFYTGNPTTSGWVIRLQSKWTTDGRWISTDIPINERHHIAITYDRGATTNDPTLYVDGTSVTVTEELTPTGTVTSAQDTVKFGENPAGSEDFNGTLSHFTHDAGTLWSATQINRHRWWGRIGGTPVIYFPLLTDKLANEGSVSFSLTATGTTNLAFPTPVVRPGAAMMGLGVGW